MNNINKNSVNNNSTQQRSDNSGLSVTQGIEGPQINSSVNNNQNYFGDEVKVEKIEVLNPLDECDSLKNSEDENNTNKSQPTLFERNIVMGGIENTNNVMAQELDENSEDEGLDLELVEIIKEMSVDEKIEELFNAIYDKNFEFIEILLDNVGDEELKEIVNTKRWNENKILHDIARYKSASCLEKVLKRLERMDKEYLLSCFNATNSKGWTILHCAGANGSVACLELILEKIKENKGEVGLLEYLQKEDYDCPCKTVFDLAFRYNHVACMRLIADVMIGLDFSMQRVLADRVIVNLGNKKIGTGYETWEEKGKLFTAIEKEEIEVINDLLENASDDELCLILSVKGYDDETALFYALTKGNVGCVEKILKRLERMSIPLLLGYLMVSNNEENTAFDLAFLYGYGACAKLIADTIIRLDPNMKMELVVRAKELIEGRMVGFVGDEATQKMIKNKRERLFNAIEQRNLNVVENILDNATEDELHCILSHIEDGCTPLFNSVMTVEIGFLEKILNKLEEMGSVFLLGHLRIQFMGETALHLTARYASAKHLKMLLEKLKKMNENLLDYLNVKNLSDNTVLDIIRKKFDPACFKVIIDMDIELYGEKTLLPWINAFKKELFQIYGPGLGEKK